jgi:prepilin-type processing-associated H-X9-DG protein/prepilin-type N-terminal cleavage/methylation domain-containing protein
MLLSLMDDLRKSRTAGIAAFTLIELLTVIAVIGVLTAILIPAIGATQQSAQKAKCASNLRQIGQAISLFAMNNNGYFPLSTHTVRNVDESWIYTIAPYLGEVDEVRICPADPQGPERLELNLTSYVLNEFVVVPNMDPFGQMRTNSYTNLWRLQNPALTMVAFIASDSMPLGDHSDHTHSRGWGNWNRVIADIQPNRFGSESSDGLGGSSNFLFADGHVDTIEAEALQQKILSGNNPANPVNL